VEILALAVTAVVALVALVALLATRRRARRARHRVDALEGHLTRTRSERDTAIAGEREAVWALGHADARAADARDARAGVERRLEGLEGELDELHVRLAAADADLAAARRDADEARTESARLETELAATARSETPTLEQQIQELRADLEAERSVVTGLRSDLEASQADLEDDSYRERLIASEARRRDLEDRLASLSSVRAAEQRTTADRIAGLERLHVAIGERDERIEALEADLKSAEEARDESLEDASRLQVEIVRLKGELSEARRRLAVLEHDAEALADARARISDLETELAAGAPLAAEADRLRKALEAERARAERISRRAAETAHDTTYAMWDRVVRERVDAAVARDTDRLKAEVDHLREVVAEKEERLRALTSGSSTTAAVRADLPPVTAIKGIGARIAGILADHGIATIPDIADLTDDDIDALALEMPIYPGRIRDDDWVGQARAILDGPVEVMDEIATESPPITAIKGIGEKIAAILAEQGITSIEHVAALDEHDIDELSEAMPVYPGRIRDDDWVGQARSFL
jgi:predicted flap endonuclease-1-like 5' DNA nuclease